MSANTPYRKKLIEVALPLPEINDASAYDKMPGIGPHPKGIHHWWARLPLPTARAVLFASVVDDPSSHPDKWPTEEAQNAERERLFGIIRRLMGKRLHESPGTYAEAHAEMLRHCDGRLPPLVDPFAGGGSIPLEANRLGFEAHARDLNPIAVLLNKCNLELAHQWADRGPVNPKDKQKIASTDAWRGTYGLAADLRYYGQLVRERMLAKIGHLYPKVRLPKEYGGGEADVIAWIWARTVASPNPAAWGRHVPLMSTFWLSSKSKLAWLEPVVDRANANFHFVVRTGKPANKAKITAGTKLGRGAKFRCLITDTPIDDDYIRAEGKANRLGYYLVAVVAEAKHGRCYVAAPETHRRVAELPAPESNISESLAYDPRNIWCTGYGLERFNQLFTPRQLTALLTLSDLVKEVRKEIANDAIVSGLSKLDASSYANAVTTYLALAVDRCADFNNSLCRWKPSGQQTIQLFSRQTIPMIWDFVEPNITGDKAVSWHTAVNICADAVETIAPNKGRSASAEQVDAAAGSALINAALVSTDPPYYDNISYAGLSDFFYVWLRRTIGDLYPDLFSTVLVPKLPELTASPERYGGDRIEAKKHFESGFRNAFTTLYHAMDARFPLTVYYAFRQEDEESGNTDNGKRGKSVDLTTGWETLLEALIGSGFQITATWPVRASQRWRMIAMRSNALASYIVLACRPRPLDAPNTSSSQFRQELRQSLPAALRRLQQGNIAPVDFAQAAIGPGMAIYSRYSQILETDGRAMPVRTALGVINQILAELLSEQADDFDADTRWGLAWFDEFGFGDGDYGRAELLSKAKNTAINGLQAAGVVQARAGKVRLLRPSELPDDWDPATDQRLTVWEMTHHLIRALDHGEPAAAALVARLGGKAEAARELAYRLYNICERRKRAQEAQAYNALVVSWPEITRLAHELSRSQPQQATYL